MMQMKLDFRQFSHNHKRLFPGPIVGKLIKLATVAATSTKFTFLFLLGEAPTIRIGTFSLVCSEPLQVGSFPWSAVRTKKSSFLNLPIIYAISVSNHSKAFAYPEISRLWPYNVSNSTKLPKIKLLSDPVSISASSACIN